MRELRAAITVAYRINALGARPIRVVDLDEPTAVQFDPRDIAIQVVGVRHTTRRHQKV